MTTVCLPLAITALESGLEYARECLTVHESNLGRTTLKNKLWAERMESDIRQMEKALKLLKEPVPLNMVWPPDAACEARYVKNA